jgi:hypothetical protein
MSVALVTMIPMLSVRKAATRHHGNAVVGRGMTSHASALEIDLSQDFWRESGGLKGRNMIAQGAALGTGQAMWTAALKGRNNKRSARIKFRENVLSIRNVA